MVLLSLLLLFEFENLENLKNLSPRVLLVTPPLCPRLLKLEPDHVDFWELMRKSETLYWMMMI